MQINSISPNFSGLYVSTKGMGKIAEGLANCLERKLYYRDEIDELQQKGVDVLILRDRQNPEDRAKVAFLADDGRLYKIGKQDHIKTGKKSVRDFIGFTLEYSTNYEKVIDTAKAILSGDITKKTQRETQTLEDVTTEFGRRDVQPQTKEELEKEARMIQGYEDYCSGNFEDSDIDYTEYSDDYFYANNDSFDDEEF